MTVGERVRPELSGNWADLIRGKTPLALSTAEYYQLQREQAEVEAEEIAD